MPALRPTRPAMPSDPTPRRPFSAGATRRLGLLASLALAVAGITLGGCKTEPPVQEAQRGLLEPGSFRATWKLDVDTARYGPVDQLFLRDDMLVVYTATNTIQVITANGGETSFITSDVVGANDRLWPPVLVEARNRLGPNIERVICFPTNTSFVLYTEQGGRVQETQIRRAITAPSAAYEGLVYTGLTGSYATGRVARIDPTREVAPVLNAVQLSGGVASRPAVFQDIVYAADDTGRVWAIAGQRQQAWVDQYFATSGAIQADLQVDAFGLYVASTDSQLYCLDRTTGRLKWSYFAEVPLYRSPYVTERFVFQPVEGTGVVCLDKIEGDTVSRSPLWTAPEARDVLSQDENNIYLLLGDGRIAAHDKETGEELFRSQRTDFRSFARNATGSRIFAARPDGQIVAIDPVLRRGQVGELVMSDPAGQPLASGR